MIDSLLIYSMHRPSCLSNHTLGGECTCRYALVVNRTLDLVRRMKG